MTATKCGLRRVLPSRGGDSGQFFGHAGGGEEGNGDSFFESSRHFSPNEKTDAGSPRGARFIIRGRLESKGCPVLRALPRYFHCCSTNLKRNWRAIAREAVARNEIIYNLGRFRTLTQV